MGDFIANILLYSYFSGILWICIGIWFIRFIIKNPTQNKLSQGGDMKGWAAGIGGILLGLTIIILKALNKF